MKSKKILSFFLAFILSFSVLFNPLIVHANTFADIFWRDYKFTTGENKDRFQLELSHFFIMCLEDLGVFINPTKWGEGHILDNFYDFMSADLDIVTTADQEEFIAKHIQVSGDQASDGAYITNNNLSITADGELANAIYAFAQAFVEENAIKYRIFDTRDYLHESPSVYSSKTQYDAAQEFLKKHENDIVINFDTKGSGTFYVMHGDVVDFFYHQETFSISSSPQYKFYLNAGDENYTMYNLVDWYYYNKDAGKYLPCVDPNNGEPYVDRIFGNSLYYSGSKSWYRDPSFTFFSNLSYQNGKAIMVFDSREHAVDWIAGHRDIYTTDKFNNYQSGNNIRITGDTLNNYSNMYNIINSTVNNYYENGGGFTDDQIQQIIDAIVAALEGSGSGGDGSGGDGSGSGSGNGDGDTNITVSGGDNSGGNSGGGLSGGFSSFLEGLGKILDAILYILGKLLEYIGKAIELFVDTIAKVLDIVPKAFSEFLAAVFPFFPTEIFTAIELILALSVILMVIKMFKK